MPLLPATVARWTHIFITRKMVGHNKNMVESTKRWISLEKKRWEVPWEIKKRGKTKKVQHSNMLHAEKMVCFYSFLWLHHSIYMHFHNINWLKVVPCDGKLLPRILLWLVLQQGNSHFCEGHITHKGANTRIHTSIYCTKERLEWSLNQK